MNRARVKGWKREELQLSQRKPIPGVSHWVKEGEPQEIPPNDISIHPTCVITYTGIHIDWIFM